MLKNLFNKFSVTKLYDDLDYWIFIGCGDDIVDLKHQRQEYKLLVEEAQKNNEANIPKAVLLKLESELILPFFERPTFWHLVKLQFSKLMRII